MRAAALRSYRELLQAAWVREVPVGPVDETLTRVGRILREAGIHFAVAGGFAVIEHGYERFTKDVDLLVHAGDLSRAMKALRAAGFRGGRTPIGAGCATSGRTSTSTSSARPSRAASRHSRARREPGGSCRSFRWST